jgi:hypothetical protein
MQVAIQVANVISIIARYDFPQQWYDRCILLLRLVRPNLLPNLIAVLSQSNGVFDKTKSLIAIYHCVKVFKSQKRPQQRSALMAVRYISLMCKLTYI